MSSTEEIIEEITNLYDDGVADLSLEDAIEVAEGVSAYLTGALAGLREDAQDG
jgi:hypothetical protein